MGFVKKVIGFILLFWVWVYLLGAINNFLYDKKGAIDFSPHSTTSHSVQKGE